MKTLRILAVGLLLGSIGPDARASGSAGATPLNFLFLDANARAVGMSGAYTALATDSNALLYNPAGLAGVSFNETTFMHNQYFEGISQEYLGFASTRGFGLNLNYVNAGEETKTTISNPNGTGLGRVGASDLAIGAGYAREIVPSLSLGAGVKYIRESIDDVTATGYGTDFGALYRMPTVSGLRLGAALQNIGPSIRYQHAKENLPFNVRLGSAYSTLLRTAPSTISFDLTKARGESVLLAVGLETYLASRMALRFGFNTRNDAGPGVSFGLGGRAGNYSLDYALVPFGELGASHRISVSLEWGARKGAEPSPSMRPPESGIDAPPPMTVRDRFKAANDLIELERYDKAEEQLNLAAIAMTHDMEYGAYHERIGRIRYLQKLFGEAKTAYMEALMIAVSRGIAVGYVADAYLGLARCALADGRKEAALPFLKKGLEAHPTPNTREEIDGLLRELGAKPGD